MLARAVEEQALANLSLAATAKLQCTPPVRSAVAAKLQCAPRVRSAGCIWAARPKAVRRVPAVVRPAPAAPDRVGHPPCYRERRGGCVRPTNGVPCETARVLREGWVSVSKVRGKQA